MDAGSAAATVVAALIGSAPGWVGLYFANRRDLDKQTRQIKEHVEQQIAAQRPPEP